MALLLFIATMPPGLTWRNGGGDGGELAAAATAFGVAHPTGYPLWLLLARGALALPLPGEPAFRLNLFSAVCAAAAVTLLSCLLLLLLRPRVTVLHAAIAGAAAPALLAASPAFWGQAIITEVYALHYLLITVLLLAWTWLRASPSTGRAALFGAAAGVGLAHHATIVLLAPGLALALGLERRRFALLGWRGGLLGAAAALPGLALYALLPLNALRQPLMNWGDPRTLPRFFAQVTAADYQVYLRETPMLTALERIPVAARLLLEQFGWIGFLLLVWGLWELWGEDRPLFAVSLAGSAAVLAHALHYNAADSDVYLVPMYLLLALPLCRGAIGLLQSASSLTGAPAPDHRKDAPPKRSGGAVLPRPGAILARLAAPAAAALLLALPALSAAQNLRRQDLSHDREPETWVSGVLARLPERAVIVTHADHHLFTLWYAQIAQGRRPDVLILDYRLLGLPWFLENQRRLSPELPWPAEALPVAQLPAFRRQTAAAAPRPLYLTYPETAFPVIPSGSLYRTG
ncbi:MAG: DUF2723 domain-containing protein [Chloroflexi bacterium]|nr:DUF2723 domain-containing protein [Chloroflexota bacterium]